MASFHLSLPVKSLDDSVTFFEDVLGGTVIHRDASGYVNVELFDTQLTLAETPHEIPELTGFHFGFNLDLAGFEAIAQRVAKLAPASIVMAPTTVDAGTPRERRKLFLRCPAGYLVEIKGHVQEVSP